MADTHRNQLRTIPQATGQSEALNVEGASRIFIHALDGPGGAFVGTANMQVSLDGTNWVNSATGQALTNNDYEEIAEMARFVRVDITVYTSGELLVSVGTFEPA